MKQLREDDAEKAKITQELQILTKRLAQVNESIARKVTNALPPYIFDKAYLNVRCMLTLSGWCGLLSACAGDRWSAVIRLLQVSA